MPEMIATELRPPPQRRHGPATWRGALAALIVMSTGVVAEAAHASASPCGGAGCISVEARGLNVSTVEPSVMVPPNASYFGHSETWGAGFRYNTQDRWFYNASKIAWARPNTLGRNLKYAFWRDFPDDSMICSTFWRKAGNGYFNAGTACARIHR